LPFLQHKKTAMKKIFFPAIICLISVAARAQNNIGIGTSTPSSSALLDISSTSKGLLTPRMTTVQRNAVATPAKGLLVYDTDLNSLYHFNGTAWAAVGGSGGSFSLPYSGSGSYNGDAFSITNLGTGSAITATASGNSVGAMEGTTNATTGGYGLLGTSSTAGSFGIGGANANGTAVYGFSAGTGTALRGVSTNGYGLLVSGNIRLTGGNTSPAEGAVLTSTDANGNAVWKQRKVAFSAVNATNESIASSVIRKIEFDMTEHNIGNGFAPYTGTVSTGSSVFTAPVTGLYNFSAGMRVIISSVSTNLETLRIEIVKNGTSVATAQSAPQNLPANSVAYPNIQRDIFLQAGDKVWITIFQSNPGELSASCSVPFIPRMSWFNGHLVFAD
jgi:C1q domain